MGLRLPSQLMGYGLAMRAGCRLRTHAQLFVLVSRAEEIIKIAGAERVNT